MYLHQFTDHLILEKKHKIQQDLLFQKVMIICFLEKDSLIFFFSWGGREFIGELHYACIRTPMTSHDGDKPDPARTGMYLHTLGLVHADPEIFENGHFFTLIYRKKLRSHVGYLNRFRPSTRKR